MQVVGRLAEVGSGCVGRVGVCMLLCGVGFSADTGVEYMVLRICVLGGAGVDGQARVCVRVFEWGWQVERGWRGVGDMRRQSV